MTLMEILVVMSIMVIIVSAIVVAAYNASKRGQVEATRSLLTQLVQGLAQYRATYHMYVPGSDAWPDKALWQALEYDGKFVVGVGASNKVPGGTFTDAQTGAVTTWYYYQDAWKQPISYQYNCDFTGTATGGSSSTLKDTYKTWVSDQLRLGTLRVISSGGSVQTTTIGSNTDHTIYTVDTLLPAPSSGTSYQVIVTSFTSPVLVSAGPDLIYGSADDITKP
jgi:Tfp pilus assembly protein PilE